MRSILFAIVLLGLMGPATQASASWSGYWTWTGTSWLWTWVWTSPNGYVSSAASLAATSEPGQADCCGITVADFSSLQPASITFTGLLATEFYISYPKSDAASNTSDLVLTYDGSSPIAPDAYLGTITLADPDVTPSSANPVTLDFTESFRDSGGHVLRQSGTINSAVPEPSTSALLLVSLLGLAAVRSRSRIRSS